MNRLKKDSFEVPVHEEERGEFSVEGSARTDSALDEESKIGVLPSSLTACPERLLN